MYGRYTNSVQTTEGTNYRDIVWMIYGHLTSDIWAMYGWSTDNV